MRPNLPNSISFFRVAAGPVLMVFLLVDIPAGDIVALVVFVVAAASDSLDGYLARRCRQTTVLGAFLDPLADKLLVTAALVSLVRTGRTVRLGCYGCHRARVRGVGAAHGGGGAERRSSRPAGGARPRRPVRCWPSPRSSSSRGGSSRSGRWADRRVTWYLVMVMLVLTVVSGVDYFVHARGRAEGPGSDRRARRRRGRTAFRRRPRRGWRA